MELNKILIFRSNKNENSKSKFKFKNQLEK